MTTERLDVDEIERKLADTWQSVENRRLVALLLAELRRQRCETAEITETLEHTDSAMRWLSGVYHEARKRIATLATR